MILTGVTNAVSSNPAVGVMLIQNGSFFRTAKLATPLFLVMLVLRGDLNPCAVWRVCEETLQLIFFFP